MVELLTDRLGVIECQAVGTGGKRTIEKPKHRQVTNILEWIQCYTIYVVVWAEKHPDKIRDMLGYQTLIIVEARMKYKGDGWLEYDCYFW